LEPLPKVERSAASRRVSGSCSGSRRKADAGKPVRMGTRFRTMKTASTSASSRAALSGEIERLAGARLPARRPRGAGR